MVAQKKIFTVSNLTEKINQAKALFLTDYRGLNVEQLTKLRQLVNEAGGELEVIKNRLFKLALKGSQKNQGKKEPELTGPTAILWANEDEISPIKALTDFAQEAGLPTIKFGFLGTELLTDQKISELSKIPSRNQLEAKLVNLVNSPIQGLHQVLSGNLQKLVIAFKEIANLKKEVKVNG